MDYKNAGVNIDAGNKAVSLIKDKVAQTFSPNVLQGLGSFAGFYELPKGYENPVLVSCTDGVGTKLKLAIETGVLDTVGIDLVAMCVNDLICCGAKPLFFLDYIACHKVIPHSMDAIISGMTTACKEVNCSLVGGEMAEMNDMYQEGDFDLAGFSVGVVEKSKIIDGSKITAGSKLYGIPSSGIHSNGYSLVRKVMSPDVLKKHGLSTKDLLTPTRLYVEPILGLITQYKIEGIAHITGGGLVENIERILPKGLALEIDYKAIPIPPIFHIIQEEGAIADTEMWRVFNMGIGMVVITNESLPPSPDLIPIGTVLT